MSCREFHSISLRSIDRQAIKQERLRETEDAHVTAKLDMGMSHKTLQFPQITTE